MRRTAQRIALTIVPPLFSFGEAKPQKASTSSISVTQEHPRPFLEINFHYLSGALLELRGIKAESPVKKPSSSALHSKDSNAAASGSGLNAKGDVKPNLKRKKAEVIVLGDGTSDDDSDAEVVKKEKKVKKEVKPIAKGEVIDLTSD